MKISEENFINELKNKNEKALEYLIDNYGWIIKTVCKKHLIEFPNLLDDCMNEILMDIWKNINRFDSSKGEIKNWIAGISKFKSIDFKRKYFKDLKLEHISDLNISSDTTIELSILEIELSDETENLLKCLKKVDRELFIKLYIEDQKIEDISSQTGIKKDIIYNRISRGKRKIKNLFAETNY